MLPDGQPVGSWGNVVPVLHRVIRPAWSDLLPEIGALDGSVLPRGRGRSYGDSCLNPGGTLLDGTALDRLLSFDPATGVLRCEAGVTLAEILRLFVPRGFFLPVALGTKEITVGGAIANDVHGKNHHRAGTFGCHVVRFGLHRSDRAPVVCSAESEPELFAATIGGLGLTGFVPWAEIRLVPVAGAFIDAETIQFRDLDEYFDLARESDVSFEHTSAWADFTSGGSARGRGIFLRGNFTRSPRTPHRAGFSVPFFAPEWLLNRFSIRAFNHLYFTRLTDRSVRRRVHYDPFFFPLDVVKSWNRLYGRRGLFQYQFVVPPGAARRVMAGVSEALDGSGVRPFLTILKSFGPRRSPGILSFPMEGLTVALDFPNLGEPTRRLFDRLDSLVADHGGRVYPAKDARMSAGMFRRFFPRLAEFSRFVDPKCSSGLWRRVMGVAHA